MSTSSMPGHRVASIVWIALALACGHAPGTAPHEMGRADHDAAAHREERASEEHAAQFDADATRRERRCDRAKQGVCWTSVTNPTASHAREAQRHRQLAQEHRAASGALSAAEARACAGLSDEDRDTSPFLHTEDIRSVTVLTKDKALGKVVSTRSVGAQVVFRAVPGMTAEWLQRLVDCHSARNAAIGFAATASLMPGCPLAAAPVRASVRSVGDGFAISIQPLDDDDIDEVVRRARALPEHRQAAP